MFIEASMYIRSKNRKKDEERKNTVSMFYSFTGCIAQANGKIREYWTV